MLRTNNSILGRSSILIVGINYWPEPTGSAPYTTGIAEHLSNAGADVTVLTGMPYYPQWSIPDPYRGRIRSSENYNGVFIRRFWTYVPSNQSAIHRSLFEAGFFFNALAQLGLKRPDLILGIDPSLSGAMLAHLLAKRWNAPYGVIIQDLVTSAVCQSGIAGGHRLEGIARKLEGKALREAAGVAIVAEGFRKAILAMGVQDHRIHRIRNWTHIKNPTLDRLAARRMLGLLNSDFVCLHAGNMGQKQGLENIIEAARLSASNADSPLFILQGDGNTRTELERRAAGLPNVRFAEPQPEADFPNTLAAADLLLVNQKPQITDMCLPGKLTSYFVAGRPVLAAVNPSSETAAELRHARAGHVVPAGEPEALLRAIDLLRADPDYGAALVRNARHFAETELTPAAAFAAVDDFIDEIARGVASSAAAPVRAPRVAD